MKVVTRKTLKLLFYVLVLIQYFLSYLVPKSKYKWIFGAWYGLKYSDNARYFFEYINNEHPEIKAIWISKNKKVIKEITAQGYKSYYYKSLKGIYHLITGKVLVLNNSKEDINNKLLSVNHFTAQLWHGVGNKKIVYANLKDPVFSSRGSLLKLWLFPFLNMKYSLVISSSLECQNQFTSAFKLSKEKVPITGYPRNDIFFKQRDEDKKQEKMIILYAPTFRQHRKTIEIKDVIPSEKILNQIDNFLVKKSAVFIIKLHPIDEKDMPDLKSYKNIQKYNDMIDTQQLLKDTSILLTDYSSIYFDYLLLNRPIIFTPFNLDDYLSYERDFQFKYQDITPGYKAKDWNEVISLLEKIINNNAEDSFKKERERIRELFWQFQDGNNSERVYKEICKRIKI